jgi:modular serine protease
MLYNYITIYTLVITGGSLVSRRLVVTAAHCIYNKGEIEPIREYDVTCFMGKHKLGDLFEKHYVISGVERFILHPDWNPKEVRYNSDVSIAVLTKTIEFTKLVKPICLWHQNGDRIDLNRGPGLIAGEKIKNL